MASVVSRMYGNFRGVDFRGDEINLSRSPDSLNMWKDYRQTDGIHTRPKLRLTQSFSEPVYGIFFYKDMQLIHSGDKLYEAKNGKIRELFSGLNQMRSNAFIYDNIWYFKDGKYYLQYSLDDAKDEYVLKEVEGYVPTTSIGRKEQSGGTEHEALNFLTGRRVNTFLGDEIGKEFWLDCQNIDEDFPPIVKINGELKTSPEDYSVDYEAGEILFAVAPPLPETAGQDNISVEFCKTDPKKRDIICKCTLLQVFDNRVFFSGNPDYPNVIYHCALNDPTYCSDYAWYPAGTDPAEVRGLVAGNNALWVFREPSDANTNVFYYTPSKDENYERVYPSYHSSITTGCVGRAINFGDDIVFFSDRGMEGVSGDIMTEQVISHRSSLVDRKLIAEKGYKDMLLEEWEGYLLVLIGNKVYLADSRTAFSYENHSEYEWFYWELDRDVVSAKVQNGILYIGTEDGVYELTDYEGAVESYWVTPKDRFKHPNRTKTTNKRGSVAEAFGDVSLFVKTEDSEYEKVGEHKGVQDCFVNRIKKKKFKDIQLKFHSNTRFSLESVTLECFLGGYIKGR